jgi:hypothetical protein
MHGHGCPRPDVSLDGELPVIRDCVSIMYRDWSTVKFLQAIVAVIREVFCATQNAVKGPSGVAL